VEHGGDATTYFRIGADQELRVRAVSTTDPKEVDLKNCHYALFDGTFDLRSKKWLTANARALDREEYNGVETGLTYSETELRDTSFETPEKKAEWLDERLNEVYTSVRLLLPPNSFTAVKKEQIEWPARSKRNASRWRRGLRRCRNWFGSDPSRGFGFAAFSTHRACVLIQEFSS